MILQHDVGNEGNAPASSEQPPPTPPLHPPHHDIRIPALDGPVGVPNGVDACGAGCGGAGVGAVEAVPGGAGVHAPVAARCAGVCWCSRPPSSSTHGTSRSVPRALPPTPPPHLIPTAPAAMLGSILGTKKGLIFRSLPSA